MSDSDSSALPHLSAEFFVWLWFTTEKEGGTLHLGDDPGTIDVWVDERLSFRAPDEDKVRAVMTGENTAVAPEARAALLSGKVVRDLQLHLRREEREYTVTLRGVHLDLSGAKLPAHAADGAEALVLERMFLYEELWFLVGALYRRFAEERTATNWRGETLPAIRAWASGTP